MIELVNCTNLRLRVDRNCGRIWLDAPSHQLHPSIHSGHHHQESGHRPQHRRHRLDWMPAGNSFRTVSSTQVTMQFA